jgi:hypothetical protein
MLAKVKFAGFKYSSNDGERVADMKIASVEDERNCLTAVPCGMLKGLEMGMVGMSGWLCPSGKD